MAAAPISTSWNKSSVSYEPERCLDSNVAHSFAFVASATGVQVSIADVASSISKNADVLLFGEYHDDPAAHMAEHALFSEILSPYHPCSSQVSGLPLRDAVSAGRGACGTRRSPELGLTGSINLWTILHTDPNLLTSTRPSDNGAAPLPESAAALPGPSSLSPRPHESPPRPSSTPPMGNEAFQNLSRGAPSMLTACACAQSSGGTNMSDIVAASAAASAVKPLIRSAFDTMSRSFTSLCSLVPSASPVRTSNSDAGMAVHTGPSDNEYSIGESEMSSLEGDTPGSTAPASPRRSPLSGAPASAAAAAPGVSLRTVGSAHRLHLGHHGLSDMSHLWAGWQTQHVMDDASFGALRTKAGGATLAPTHRGSPPLKEDLQLDHELSLKLDSMALPAAPVASSQAGGAAGSGRGPAARPGPNADVRMLPAGVAHGNSLAFHPPVACAGASSSICCTASPVVFHSCAEAKRVHNKAATGVHPRRVVLSLEMFERDVQQALDGYASAKGAGDSLVEGMRAWANYRDYCALIDLAVTRDVRVVASNAPRAAVAAVAAGGPSALDGSLHVTHGHVPPPPLAAASDDLAEKLAAEFAASAGPCQVSENSQRRFKLSPNFLAAQSLWDSTMAWSIAEALHITPGVSENREECPLVFHVCGRFHMEKGLGIPEHLRNYAPEARVATCVAVPTLNVASAVRAVATGDEAMAKEAVGSSLEALRALGDFIVFTDARLPRTFEIVPDTTA